MAGAEQAAEEAASLARTHGFEDVRALLLEYEAQSSFGTLPMRQLERFSREAHEALANAGQRWEAAEALRWATLASLAGGRLDEAKEAAAEAAAYARSVGRVDAERYAVLDLAIIALLHCQFERFEELAAAITAGAPAVHIQQLRASRAELSAEPEQAIELLPDLAVGRGNPLNVVGLRGDRARVLLSAGRDEAARREFAQLVELMPRIPSRWRRFDALSALDVAGAVLGDAGWVRRLYEEYISYAASEDDRLRVSHIPGRGFDAVKGALALRLDLVDEAEQHYRSGLEWAERERCPVEAGRCQQGLAEVAERRGDHALASQHLDAAAELFSEHGAKLYLDQVLAKKEILKA
jgi:tetratricopeptide (TPR) repeat protein